MTVLLEWVRFIDVPATLPDADDDGLAGS